MIGIVFITAALLIALAFVDGWALPAVTLLITLLVNLTTFLVVGSDLRIW